MIHYHETEGQTPIHKVVRSPGPQLTGTDRRRAMEAWGSELSATKALATDARTRLECLRRIRESGIVTEADAEILEPIEDSFASIVGAEEVRRDIYLRGEG